MRLLAAVGLLVLWTILVALQSQYPPRVDELIGGLVAFLVMLAGPKPLKWFYDLIGVPGGPWRVIATYAVSFIVAFVALVVAGAITGLPTDITGYMALAGVLMAATNAAYHRLKDLGEFTVQ
jgi:hypothetical protein